ncbi:MAG: hypothetical protein ABII97_02325 [Patescibacteria group bacterium]
MKKRPIFFLKIFIVFLLFIVFGFYFFHQSKAFLFGPQITISEPSNGESFTESLMQIRGSALNTIKFSINENPIIIDSYGKFEESLILAYGYNIIELSAEDKFGRAVYKKLEVTLK